MKTLEFALDLLRRPRRGLIMSMRAGDIGAIIAGALDVGPS